MIVKTGRHKARSITLVENAKAIIIIKKLKYVNKEEDVFKAEKAEIEDQ